MLKEPSAKYRPFPPVHLPNRQWPNRTLTHAPIWCSVDLRDGNQALAVPMNVSQKLELFQTLVKCGFKEIEVGFPSASNTEFTFNRRLIEEHRAPDDVWLQVLVQAREDLIERTVESLVGAKKAIIHLYNSTSPAQRRVVFGMSKDQILNVAVRGAKWVKERLPRLQGTEVRLQYSPESFSATEVEFAKEVSEAVMDIWKPTPQHKMILNLPDTVEVATPNVYADQIEWMCCNLKNRDSALISLHTHNDRSTGTAATELGLLAGADRVEGTLFGNGERTGNLDIITVALNLYMQGINPQLDFTHLNSIREVYERCTGMTVPARHPYAGELVFTAFSGSHQDAIKKGLAEWETGSQKHWDVPYLTIDPADIGRKYREVIRVNGQSGKAASPTSSRANTASTCPRNCSASSDPSPTNKWTASAARSAAPSSSRCSGVSTSNALRPGSSTASKPPAATARCPARPACSATANPSTSPAKATAPSPPSSTASASPASPGSRSATTASTPSAPARKPPPSPTFNSSTPTAAPVGAPALTPTSSSPPSAPSSAP